MKTTNFYSIKKDVEKHTKDVQEMAKVIESLKDDVGKDVESIKDLVENDKVIVDKITTIGNNIKFESYYSLITSFPNEDASLIRTEDGKFILIDTGETHTSKKLVAKLKKLGVKQLDILVITHSHSDHVGGAVDVITEFKPKVTYFKEVDWNILGQTTPIEIEWKTVELHNKMKQALINNKCDFIITTGDTTEVVLSDKESFTLYNGTYIDYTSYNSASLIMLYRNGGTKLLLCGDASAEVLAKYQQTIGYCHFCKLPHHGGFGNTQLSWIEHYIKPSIVLSNTINVPYGLEAFEKCVWANNAKCYHFKENLCDGGTVSITSGGVTVANGLTLYSINSRILPMYVNGYNKIKYYYVDGNGELVYSGVKEYNGELYFINDWKVQDEESELGWKTLGSDEYFVKKGGICARDEFIVGNGTTPGQSGTYYYMDSSGKLIKNVQRMIGSKYFSFGPTGIASPSPV